MYPVIILAGGLGTRLSHVLGDVPKPMAPVNGKPFLHYILERLSSQGISEVVMAVGHLREQIMDYFKNEYLGIRISYSVEQELLGTGGGIKQAFDQVTDKAFVLNGDTFFDVKLQGLAEVYEQSGADICLALREMKNFDRYGTVDVSATGRILAFHEKAYRAQGLINGGVYFLDKAVFSRCALDKRFSFEKDLLEKYMQLLLIQGMVSEAYFIDIGIPEDYERAQAEFGQFTR